MDEQSKESLDQEIKSAEEVISKLKKFANELVNNPNSNILTHLCDGLEKFLGFNPSSKGYDGTGIVYSDLDRLCDAVMGFLSGVLKDVSEKQPYSVGKTILNDIVTELEKSLSTGREGFSVIERVAEKVREYNGSVKQSNEKVKEPINVFIKELKEKKNIFENIYGDSDDAVKWATGLVDGCMEASKTHVYSMDAKAKQINDMDHDLKVRLNGVETTVKHEYSRLHELAWKAKDNLEAMRSLMDVTMKRIRTNVNVRIEAEVDEFVDGVKGKMRIIVTHLVDIRIKLRAYVIDLQNWMDEAKKFVEEVQDKVNDDIINEVSEASIFSHVKPTQIAADALQKKAEKLRHIAMMAKTRVGKLVKKTLTAVNAMNDALKQDLAKIRGEIEGAVKHLASNLLGNIKTDLGTLRGKITVKLKPIVDSSEEFNKQISETQRVLQTAIGNVERNIKCLSEFPRYMSFSDADGRPVLAPLLQIFGGQKAFTFLTTYLNRLHEQLISKFKVAMDGIATGIIRGASGNIGELQSTLNTAQQNVEDFKAMVEGKTKRRDLNFDHVDSELNTTFGIEFNARENLKSQFFKIKGSSDMYDRFYPSRHNSNEKIIKELAAIGQAVSEHSQQLVAEVLSKVQQKVKSEIQVVAGSIHKQVSKSYALLGNEEIGDKINTESLIGLHRLANKFSTEIDTALRDFQGKFDSEFFRQNGSGNADYAIGNELMSTFHGTYNELLSGKIKKDGKDVLQQQLPVVVSGPVNMPESKGFGTYSTHVKQEEEILTLLKQGNMPEDLKKAGDLPMAIKGIEHEVNGDDILGKIKPTGTPKDSAKDDEFYYDTFGNLCGKVNEELKKLCDAVRNGASTVNDRLRNFKIEKVDNLLQNDVKNRIETLIDTEFNAAINAVNNFITNGADAEKEKTVTALKNHVTYEIDLATSTLTTLARKQYVTSVKDLLTAFAQKVTEELSPLPDLIDVDRREGFKGFMRTLQGVMNDDGTTTDVNITLIKTIADTMNTADFDKEQTFIKLSYAFRKFYFKLNEYANGEITRVHDDNKAKKNPPGQDTEPYSSKLEEIKKVVDKLLGHIADKQRYDYKVPEMLEELKIAVADLKPENFDKPNTPVMDALTHGLQEFIGELKRVYISAYDSQSFKGDLLLHTKTIADTRESVKIFEWTEEGKNCAKVCLSILPIVYHELTELHNKLDEHDGDWEDYKIYNPSQPGHGLHNLFFRENGYDAGLPDDTEHGVLNHKKTFNGVNIRTNLNDQKLNMFTLTPSSPAPSGVPGEPIVQFVDANGVIPQLYAHLENYFGVCHLIGHAKRRHPCSVYEMLCWLTGLPHNPVYTKLRDHVTTLFLVADKNNPSIKVPKPILTSHSSITKSHVLAAVRDVCETSYAVLTAVVGTGDAATHHACELPNNSSRLIYPTNGADCLDMLLDILRRLFPLLQFLHTQCKLKTKHNGWYSCEYGRDIRTTKWPCDEHTKESRKEPTKCLPKSPLQSYLSDCLPGHLPHNLTSIGCKAECNTCPKKPHGRPCLTPMGFRGFSGSTKTGKDLCSVLSKLLDTRYINSLSCLIPKPPSTLSEHFGFALSLVEGWHTWRDTGSINPLQASMEDHISAVSMELVKRGDATNALRLAYGSSQANHFKHDKDSPDLCSLSMQITCSGRDANCAPYVSTLCTYLYDYLAYKNCNLYLSWAIYLPWTFWDLLNNLYNAFCSINCQDWGCRGCLRGDKCKKGEHGVVDDEKPTAICQCRSIVDCKGVAPTLYQYGFVFGEASTLNDKASPKTCSDFCSQLKNALESQYFQNLFKECDNFLWTIRTPFSYLVLALWLLSLLYLTHIMVIRLDLLHIKSHLHSPSSHRIAAQSLLAASRVNKLNRVFYLQP